MADGVVGVKQSDAPDRLVDNEVVTNDQGQTVYRQKTLSVLATQDGKVSPTNPLPVSLTSNGGQAVFVRTGAPNSDDPGVVVRVAGTLTTKANLQVAGADVTDTNAVPTKTWLFDINGQPYSRATPLPVDIGAAEVTATFASKVSVANSSQTPLAANATFTGAWEDVRDYAAITAAISSDVPSATNGVIAEFAVDAAGTMVVNQQASTYPGGGFGFYFAFPPGARYFRVRYTNGPTAQTYLRSQVEYEFTAPTVPQQPIGAQLTDTNLASVVRSAIAGKTPSGLWAGLKATIDGILRVNVDNPVTIQKTNGHVEGTLTAASSIATASQTYWPSTPATSVVLAVPDGHSSSLVELSGTFGPNSQVVFEQSDDLTAASWAATNMRRNLTPDVNESYSQIDNNPKGTSNVQIWKGTVGAARYFRVRCSALAVGDTIQVSITTSEGVGGTFLLGNPPSVSDYFATGTLAAAGDTVEVKSGGMGSFAALFQGQYTGKVQIEQTIDGTTWRPTNTIQTGGILQAFVSGTGVASQVVGARGSASGTTKVRLRADTDFVGSITGTLRTGAGSIGGFLTSPIQVGGLAQGSQTARQTVGTTATRIDPSALSARTSVEVRAMSSNTVSVFVGFNSSVTTATGRELLAGEAWTLDVTTATLLYAIAASNNQQVQVTELG